MERTTGSNTNNNIQQRFEVLSALVSRLALAGRLGMSYDGARNLYQALGYELSPTIEHFYAQYKRQDIANAIIDRPAKATWRGPLQLLESSKAEDTQFEKAWKALETDLSIKTKLIQLDKLTGLGKYGVLLLGFADTAVIEDFEKPASGTKLVYLKAYSEKSAVVESYVEDSKDPRYGLPKYYSVSTGGKTGKTIRVHYSRVIHVIQNELDSEIEGAPVLEAVFNRLQDLEKLAGGSAEMYWRGARPGYQGKVDKDFSITQAAEDSLREKIDEYEHNLRRILINEGISMEALQQQVSDPKNAIDIQISLISAQTGIPKRILTGSERGELASSQDADNWNSYIQSRREEFAEPKIVRPLVDTLIKMKVLPAPGADGYTVAWQDLFAPSAKEKAEVGKTRAEALNQYASGMADSIVPPEAFFQFFLGLNPDEIELINQMKEEQVAEDINNEVDPDEEELLREEEEQRRLEEEQQDNPVE